MCFFSIKRLSKREKNERIKIKKSQGGGTMANTVEVSSNIWNWINTSVQVPDAVREKFEQWRSGEKKPTFSQLEAFSQKIHVPIGYFFLERQPQEQFKLLEFRTVDSRQLQDPSRELIDTLRQMESIQEWMRDDMIAGENEENRYVGSLCGKKGIAELAAMIRETLSLPSDWYEAVKSVAESFRLLREAISRAGVLVMMNGVVGGNTHRALNVSEFRAFTLIDAYAPLIFINAADSESGRVFSLLHEFVHIGLGTNSLFNAREGETEFVRPEETLCNAVAAEVLVPRRVFCNVWENTAGIIKSRVQELSKYFNCSQSVIARRALDEAYITEKLYRELIEEAIRLAKETMLAKKARGGGGDYYRTQLSRMDHRFLQALDASVQEGKTLYTEAFRLTNTNRVTFDKLLEKVQGERV